MKSPFPGMDPFLESSWGDLHHRLIQYSCDAMQAHLPDTLRARVEERVYVEDEEGRRRQIIPDLLVSEVVPWESQSSAAEGGVAVAEPYVVELSNSPVTEGFIEIRERGGGRLVTVIEFLSPANKCGGVGQKKYLEKQNGILRSQVNLVEIDLIRAGEYVLAAQKSEVPWELLADYLTCISPAGSRDIYELYAMPMRSRLPVLPIPLRTSDRRIALDLQALLDHAYQAGRYGDTDYSAPLPFPLAGDQAAWIAATVQRRDAGNH